MKLFRWNQTLRILILVLVFGLIGLVTTRATASEVNGNHLYLNGNMAQAATPPGASISTKVEVPSSMRSSPFDVDRFLNIPPNFGISVYARVGGARFMAVTPSGDLLVSQPGAGKVVIIRSNPSGDPIISNFITGLASPHDIVFHTIGSTTYVYISEKNQINRFIYNNGDTTAHDRQIVVSGLPDASLPELGGSYGHELKNIALDSNDKLYVSIGSSSNSDPADQAATPVRGAIYQYNADGTNGRLYAKGLRNAEGLAFLPGTNTLWVVVNNRDNIACPYTGAIPNNSANCTKGQVVTAYVDNHPPEEFTRIRDGGNYGWPFCNPNPDTATGYDNMPFDLDQQNNADGHVDCSTMDRINKGIQAHSAPLGFIFLQNTNFPSLYRNGAVVGLHGSWNRSVKTGYKVAYFPWDTANQVPGPQVDLVTGWSTSNSDWGRPVDVAVDGQGNLLISDDASGTIYKLYWKQATATPTNTIPTSTNTSQPTATFTVSPTRTSSPTNTLTPTSTLTNTPRPTNTSLPTLTSTLTNTARPTNTNTATGTNTPRPTFTNTMTNVLTKTNTPRPTVTATATYTNTAQSTSTSTATNTSLPTNTATLTSTPTEAVTFQPPTNTSQPTITNTSTQSCPQATPELFVVEPVTSPTTATIQTINVRLGNGESVTVTSESGTFTATTPVNGVFSVTITLLPNTTHHLTVTGKVKTIIGPGGCIYGGYTLSTTHDRLGNPLIIVQQTSTPTSTLTSTPTLTPSPTLTSAPTGTTTPFKRLRLAPVCTADAATHLLWRIHNANSYDVPFTWSLISGDQQGSGTAIANTDTYFSTNTLSERWNIVVLYANGQVQDISLNSPMLCNAWHRFSWWNIFQWR